MTKIQLKPMCFDDFQMAITKEGFLLPCCYCDDFGTLNDPTMKKLLTVSNINNYNNIGDILKTKEWKQFYKNLKRNVGPPACIRTCSVNTKIRNDVHIDTKTKKVKHTRKV